MSKVELILSPHVFLFSPFDSKFEVISDHIPKLKPICHKIKAIYHFNPGVDSSYQRPHSKENRVLLGQTPGFTKFEPSLSVRSELDLLFQV
jgi:hypothetical protein